MKAVSNESAFTILSEFFTSFLGFWPIVFPNKIEIRPVLA
jgi:hypothetical protein